MAVLAVALVVVQGCSGATTGVRESTSVDDGNAAGSAQLASTSGRLTSTRGGEENLADSNSAKNKASRLSIPDIERMLVYFDFNQFSIRADMRPNLDQMAQFLLENPRIRIQVEGHTDERGTPEYNIALGFKRATGVKNYLLNLGISASRMQTVSYGEERPLDTSQNEAAWQNNRRAKFNVISGSTGRRN